MKKFLSIALVCVLSILASQNTLAADKEKYFGVGVIVSPVVRSVIHNLTGGGSDRYYSDDYYGSHSGSFVSREAARREQQHREAERRYRACLEARAVDIRWGVDPRDAKDCSRRDPYNRNWSH